MLATDLKVHMSQFTRPRTCHKLRHNNQLPLDTIRHVSMFRGIQSKRQEKMFAEISSGIVSSIGEKITKKKTPFTICRDRSVHGRSSLACNRTHITLSKLWLTIRLVKDRKVNVISVRKSPLSNQNLCLIALHLFYFSSHRTNIS